MRWIVLTITILICNCVTSPFIRADGIKQNPIFPDNVKLELLFTRQAKINSGLTEGPAVAPDGSIYFTDMPFGKADHGMILRFDPKTQRTTVFTNDSGKSNGLAFDTNGFLISCDGADGGGRRLIRWDLKTGKGTTLVDRFHAKRLNAPNDLCIDSQGRIYFTDPRYIGDEPRELKYRAVYRLNKDLSIIEITRDVEKPNGITLSPDERTLYVGDHNNGSDGINVAPNAPPPTKGAMKVYEFPLDKNGLISGPRRTLVDFGKQAGCDGMTVDAHGNIYLTCRSLKKPGLMVIDPHGKELAFLPTGPTDQSGEFEDWRGIPSNVEFGIGDEKNILYVTIDKSLYRVRVKTEGHHPTLRRKQ
ncbi:SMP-30/gluconolactonase/LRE family protein [Gimesia aquarii]|uniref:Gluconolactonase n=1 Tax=Gimesia aquarii TaxID=2527964 RepID=A0A517WZL6_9PLAN|nr:SMP-30/gluconolactonase/LRE family protein [Gimesia aquarii]QDU10700.1 Gluconolactonase precursor [Gimesia aquarii]